LPYIHFGRIGDILKHLPLAEYLKAERPRKYIETNSASPVHALSNSPEQKYGIYHFMNNCHKSDLLKTSAYYRILKTFNPDNITTYPGSSAIALSLLKQSDCRFCFYDIEVEAIQNIENFTSRTGVKEMSQCINEDSISGIYKRLDDFDGKSFIHFDPYDAFVTVNSPPPFHAMTVDL
jgi:23S rRNA (adenine2030-N6)-methyltransferase